MESDAIKVKMKIYIAEELLSIDILRLLDTAIQKLRVRVEAAVKNYSFPLSYTKLLSI